MKVNVPGRGAVDIRHVAIVGPVWTDYDMYRDVCQFLHETAHSAPGDTGRISFCSLAWCGRTNGQMLRQMVRDLADEYPDGTPCYDGVCMLDGWRTDGAAAFAAAVANTCGAVVMGLDEWARALEPADGEKGTEVSGQ